MNFTQCEPDYPTQSDEYPRGLKTSKMFTLTATVPSSSQLSLSACAIFFIKGGIDKGNFTPFLQLDLA